MPVYVYGCDQDKDHPRQEITHKMHANPAVKCTECGSTMHRVPQSMRFYLNPAELLTSWMDENYTRSRTGQRRFSPDKVKKPGSGIPQKDFDARTHKKEFK